MKKSSKIYLIGFGGRGSLMWGRKLLTDPYYGGNAAEPMTLWDAKRVQKRNGKGLKIYKLVEVLPDSKD